MASSCSVVFLGRPRGFASRRWPVHALDRIQEPGVTQGLMLTDRQADVAQGFGVELLVKERPVSHLPARLINPEGHVERMG